MGTNYYWRPLITEQQREEIINKTKSVKTLQELKDFIDGYTPINNLPYDLNACEIHIGKSSGGWQFLFNLTIQRCTSLNREDMTDWLNSGIIYNEYGDIISVNDFWRIVDSKKNDWDYSEYYKTHPEESWLNRGKDQHINGLRFTTEEYEFC